MTIGTVHHHHLLVENVLQYIRCLKSETWLITVYFMQVSPNVFSFILCCVLQFCRSICSWTVEYSGCVFVCVFTASLGWWKVVLNQPCLRAASPCWKFSRNRKKTTDYCIENMEILPEDLGESFDLVFLLKLLDTRQKHRTLQVHSSLVHSWCPAEYILVQEILWAVCCTGGWDQVCKCILSEESWDKRWVIIFPFPLSFYVFCNVGCILFVLVWQK